MTYSIVYADPPWSYRDKGCEGAAARRYALMDNAAIAALPVQRLAADDAVLFLWATYPLLPQALEVMRGWGFAYKNVAFQWVKTNPKSGTPFYGLGHWTRGNTEACLLGVRGKPRRVAANVFQIIHSPIRRHSAKPPEARERIVQLMGDLPRVELFARERAEGWDSTGLDLDGVPVQRFLERFPETRLRRAG